MTVFDQIVTMYDTDDAKIKGVYETVDALDEMLTAAGIAHAFCYPLSTDELEDGRIPAMIVMYEEEHDLEFGLIYAYYSLKHRGCESKKIADAMIKVAAKHTTECFAH